MVNCSQQNDSLKTRFSNTKGEKINQELLDEFYTQIHSFDEMFSIPIIDSLGTELVNDFPSLEFHPYTNLIEQNVFIFSANKVMDFEFLLDYFDLHREKKNSNYQVWRREINGAKILDFSIEPHPVYKWIFVVRYRAQE